MNLVRGINLVKVAEKMSGCSGAESKVKLEPLRTVEKEKSQKKEGSGYDFEWVREVDAIELSKEDIDQTRHKNKLKIDILALMAAYSDEDYLSENVELLDEKDKLLGPGAKFQI